LILQHLIAIIIITQSGNNDASRKSYA